jgi:HTH-type transcriptional regulator, global nitrogen regulator NrpRI
MRQDEKKQKNRVAILESLKNAGSLLHSAQIAQIIRSFGADLSERSVRLYLESLEQEGLVASEGRKGHRITPQGREELGSATVLERVGYMSAHVERMMFFMNFSLATRKGSVVVNVSMIPQELVHELGDTFCEVFAKGYAMGTLLGLLKPGEALGPHIVPQGHYGICTVCSISLSGILLSHGVPVRSVFCGLLEILNHRPRGIRELISYNSTSVDPLQLFINSGMTNYLGAISGKKGLIGIGFREVPAESHSIVEDLAEKVRNVGLGAFMEIGKPNQNLLNMPVREGCCGILVVGGLNPVSIFVESGYRIYSHALSGTMEYHQLFHYSELRNKLS